MTQRIIIGDARKEVANLAPGSIQTCVTSPPYYMQRDYGVDGQIGLEPTPEEYIDSLVGVFGEVRRVLTPDGTLWLNLGDTWNAYNGNRGEGGRLNRGAKHAMLPSLPSGYGLTDKSRPNKSALGIPWRVANALAEDGWIIRAEIIWHKPSAKPSGGLDRPHLRHETVFMLSHTTRRCYLGPEARAWGTVWALGTGSKGGRGHSATMGDELAARCVTAGSRPGDTVIDPFHGSGTTGRAAEAAGRSYVGIELNPEFVSEEA